LIITVGKKLIRAYVYCNILVYSRLKIKTFCIVFCITDLIQLSSRNDFLYEISFLLVGIYDFRCRIVNLPHSKPSPSEYLLYSKPSPRILYYIVNILPGNIYYIANIPTSIADHPPGYFSI
jgi:hypothetical protein